jgi:hypothetical protein
LIAIVLKNGHDGLGFNLTWGCATKVANLVARAWIGTNKLVANVSPPFLLTLVARAFAVRATGLADGDPGKYSVHLSSAVVHKLPSGALRMVFVHAQHPGWLSLIFADDDPKTAEILPKVL